MRNCTGPITAPLGAVATWLSVTLALMGLAGPCRAQTETVTISVPASVGFSVSDVRVATTGQPDPFIVSFSSAHLLLNHSLQILVKSNATGFIPPSGAAIPASNLSWTTSNARGGTGSNGVVSFSAFTLLYTSGSNPTTGSVDISWNLAAPGAGIRAGNHSLSLTWKFESIGL